MMHPPPHGPPGLAQHQHAPPPQPPGSYQAATQQPPGSYQAATPQPPGSYQHAAASAAGGAGAHALAQQFETISLGGPGRPGTSAGGPDPSSLPRPTRPGATSAPTPAHPANCSPANMRLTVNAMPINSALRARWALPLGAVVRPMADDAAGIEVPLVGLGPSGIVRCRRCR
jgi:protein transport protein SEC24